MLRIIPKILMPLALILPLSASAAPAAAETDFNVTYIAIVSMIIVLVAANALLANVLMQLAYALREKSLKERTSAGLVKTVVFLLAILIPSFSAFAQEKAAAAEVSAPAISQVVAGIPKTDFYSLMGIAGFLFLVMLVLILLIRMLTRELRGVPFTAHIPSVIFKKNFLDVFNKSVSLEEEESVVMDHNYDGIRELDNDLPPWWKWGFILTIVVAFIYMGYYRLWGGPNQIDEYNASVAKAEIEKAAFLSKSGEKIDETNVKLITDPAALADAKALFINVCAACHRPDAGGVVGPNLTDDYWLHGGSMQDVFKSIKYGWKDKGMPEWDKNLSAKQIQDLTGFVESLKGSHPANPKPPQGDLFKGSSAASGADSTVKN